MRKIAKLIRPWANTRWYYVTQDRTLFRVSGAAARQSFDDLRRASPQVTFKCVAGKWARHIQKLGAISRTIEINKL